MLLTQGLLETLFHQSVLIQFAIFLAVGLVVYAIACGFLVFCNRRQARPAEWIPVAPFATSITTPGNTSPNPISGSFRPESTLSSFIGGPAKGFWTFIVTDESTGGVGSLDAVSLNFTYQYKVKPKKKKKK